MYSSSSARSGLWIAGIFATMLFACGNKDSSNADKSGTTGADAATACAEDCTDGFSCTIDSCTSEECVHTIGPNTGVTACPAGQYCTLDSGCVAAPACANDTQCIQIWADDACKANVRCEAASSVCTFSILDKDRDGYAPQVCGGGDCNDASGSVHPEANESCNGIDDNCNGLVDEGGDSACDPMQQCKGGTCVCRTENLCSGKCVNLQTDVANCGACATACTLNQTCENGQCVCPSGAICPTLIRKYPSDDLITVLAVGSGYIIGVRGGSLVGVPMNGASEEWLASTNSVFEALVDNGMVVFTGYTSAGTQSGDFVDSISLADAVSSGPLSLTPISVSGGAPNPGDLVVHGDRVYWINCRQSSSPIMSGSETGTGTADTIGSLGCEALGGDADSLYCGRNEPLTSGNPGGDILRLGYDGLDQATLATGVVCPSNIIATDNAIYWVDECTNTIEKMSKDGTNRSVLFKQIGSLISVDGRYVYFIDSSAGFEALPISGGSAIVISYGPVHGAAADVDALYWAEGTGLYRAAKPN